MFGLLVGRRIERGAESAAEVAPERVEPDVFPGQRVGTMHVQFAAALGLTDVGPVGGAVAGSSCPSVVRWHGASGAVRTPPARGRTDGGWSPRR